MKKWIALLLAAVMCFSLVACGGGETPNADESTTPTGSLEDIRAAELTEILCGGKWVGAFGFDYFDHLPSEIYFFDDGTMKYVNGVGEEYSGNPWSFKQYVINGEIEGQPGFSPAMYETRIKYSDEQGVYYFNCEGLSIMLVGYSVDGEYIIHKDGYPYKKVAESN